MENTQIGPFKIGSRLGTNRRQKVFRAKQTQKDLDVALKFIGMPKDEKRKLATEKIKVEVKVLKELSHPNLVKVLGAGVEEHQIYFVSELVKGESLTSILARRSKLASDQVVEFGRQIASVLNYLHDKNIIHAKLTPDKILVAKDGFVKISDLRLNRSRKRRWDSARKRELDIAAYMAPEQFVDGATEKSDIYSLGVILYEMLTGKLPYPPDTMDRMTKKKMHKNAPSVSSVCMNCPVWLDKIVCQMIEPDPRKRPHTAKAIMLAMDELRLLDETKKSSVSQVSGSFNPLTAGADKSEANRLLGKKNAIQPPENPPFQSTAFLAIGLVLILGILAFALMPASSEQNFRQAEILMKSDDPGDWREARGYLKSILKKGEDNKWFSKAEELYFESRRRTLVIQAERGRLLGLQSPATKKFISAVQENSTGDPGEAQKLFTELIEFIDEDSDESFIRAEAQNRLNQVIDQIEVPTEIEALADLVNQQKNLTQTTQQATALRLLKRVANFIGENGKFDEIRPEVEQLIDKYSPTDSSDEIAPVSN